MNSSSEKTFAIIADDLTGANDTGIQFLKKGLKTVVIIDLGIESRLVQDVDVVVLNTDSRFLESEQAYVRTKQMGLILDHLGISHVYKKVDSTLRGNVGAEIDALMEVLKLTVCFMTPAFPIYHRTVRDGNLYLDDIPIHKTGIASDPTFHMKSAFIPDLLKQQTQRSIGVIRLETIRSGTTALLQEFHRLIQQGVQIFVLDALVQDDLKIAAQTLAEISSPILLCGSAGLASEISETFYSLESGVQSPKSGIDWASDSGPRIPDPGLSVIGICGSMSPVTREQVDYVVENLRIPVLKAIPYRILDDQKKEEEIQRLIATATFFLAQAKDILIVIRSSQSIRELSQDAFIRNSHTIARSLGNLALALVNTGKVSGLFLTGGDTALHVCQFLKARGIYLLDEVLPGIPFGRILGGDHSGLHIITKAGAFGRPEAIARCVGYLKKQGPEARSQKNELLNSDS
jgi:uncharacterized protein YgbK (DUF1537 family)